MIETAVRERPIIFSTPLIPAVLDGRKTMTRRTRGLEKINVAPEDFEFIRMERYSDGSYRAVFQCGDEVGSAKCLYGGPGDGLWCREAWLPDPPINGWDGDIEWNGCGRPINGIPKKYRRPEHCLYAAAWRGADLMWRSPIFMPRWACRITLEITDVRVQRLHDISDDDARAEGLYQWSDPPRIAETHYGSSHADVWETDPRRTFERIWNAMHAKHGYGWDMNPWVWAITFRRLTP